MKFKSLGAVLAILASVATIGSFIVMLTPADSAKSPAPTITQASGGFNSPNIANVQGDVTVNIQSRGTSKLDIPSYDFSLQPFPGWRRDPHLGTEFNEKMDSFLDKVVYLSITLSEEMSQDVADGRDEYGRLIFTVQNDADDHGMGGAEYLIHLTKSDKDPFERHGDIAVLSGYFKVYDINGPRQGYMSVNLRPVKVD